jgi:radical SAM protein with 4Fe4S-binding SPASM domain
VLDDAVLLECSVVRFVGGDPLTGFADIVPALQAASSKVQNVELFSNLTSVSDDMHAALPRIQNLTVKFPVLGPDKDSFASVTGRADLFENFRRNLLLLKEDGVRLSGLIIGRSEPELAASIAWLEDVAIDHSVHAAIPLRPGNDGNGLVDNYTLREPSFDKTSVFTFYSNKSFNRCVGQRAIVNVNGDVTLCLYDPSFVIGNVHQSRLKDILREEHQSALWQLTKDEIEGCRRCEYRYVCHGECPAAAKAYGGNETTKYPFCKYDPVKGIWET